MYSSAGLGVAGLEVHDGVGLASHSSTVDHNSSVSQDKALRLIQKFFPFVTNNICKFGNTGTFHCIAFLE